MQKPEEPSKASENQLDPLKVLEYAAVSASVVGSIAAAWLQQILFATTPLTLAAILNLVNRQRFEQQLRRYTHSAIADIQTVVEQSMPQATQPEEIAQFLPQQTPDNTIQNDLDPIIEAVTELQRVTQRLDEEVLRQQDWEMLNVRFKLLDDRLEQFQQQISTTDVSVPSEPIQLSPIPQAVTDLSTIQSQLDQLHHQVLRLDQQNRRIVKPYLLHLSRTVKQLQQHP
ncbi:MAG: hypothetical protein WBA77_03710 [Microcoleaceae cyanobacterium]